MVFLPFESCSDYARARKEPLDAANDGGPDERLGSYETVFAPMESVVVSEKSGRDRPAAGALDSLATMAVLATWQASGRCNGARMAASSVVS